MGKLFTWLGAFAGSGLGTVLKGVLEPIVGYMGKKQDVELDGFKTATGYDLEAFKVASDERLRMATIRASAVNGRMVTFAVGLVAVSIAFHWFAIVLDSTLTFGTGQHGNLGVAKLPTPYDAYEWELLKSLFYIGPAVPVASAVASWLHRK